MKLSEKKTFQPILLPNADLKLNCVESYPDMIRLF
jgi:hypothetical protein